MDVSRLAVDPAYFPKISNSFVTVYRDVFLAHDLYSDSFSAPLDLTHGFLGRRLRPEAFPYPGGAMSCNAME